MVIYALKDPRTDEIRYIGKTTKTLEQRLKAHLKPHELRKHTHRTHWLQELVSIGLRPEVVVIMECQDEAELNAAEVICIKFARDIGLPLTNATDGGEGTTGIVRTAENRAKLRAANLGKKASPEVRAKMSAAHKGLKMSAAAVEKLKQATRGVKKTRTQALLMAIEARRGRKVSAETKAKISAIHKGRVHSPESIEKVRLFHLGRKRSPQTCQNISAALSKPIQCSDGRVFANLKAAADALGVSASQAGNILHGRARGPNGLTLHRV